MATFGFPQSPSQGKRVDYRDPQYIRMIAEQLKRGLNRPLTKKEKYEQAMATISAGGYKAGGGLKMHPLPFTPSLGRLRIKDRLKPPKGFQRMDQGGFINSKVPGRTDKHNVLVPSGSYVLPADHVSALGQNNSVAGAEMVKKMFGPGTRFGSRLAIPRFASGGGVGEPVPVIVAGGEVILPPQVVSRIGNGDIEKGHSVLDRWVLDVRKRHIDKLKSLKPPKGADE